MQNIQNYILSHCSLDVYNHFNFCNGYRVVLAPIATSTSPPSLSYIVEVDIGVRLICLNEAIPTTTKPGIKVLLLML